MGAMLDQSQVEGWGVVPLWGYCFVEERKQRKVYVYVFVGVLDEDYFFFGSG